MLSGTARSCPAQQWRPLIIPPLHGTFSLLVRRRTLAAAARRAAGSTSDLWWSRPSGSRYMPESMSRWLNRHVPAIRGGSVGGRSTWV